MDTTPQGRLISLDALRGFVVFVMIFANDLAFVTGLPAWMQHMRPGLSGLTFVDVVYPAFLFMAGTAIPWAFERRRRDGSEGALLGHVVRRTVALSVIGLIQMNGRTLDRTGVVPYAVWNVAALAAVLLLVWRPDPPIDRARVRLLRAAAIVVLLLLVAVYRSKYGGWLQPGNRGILGAIAAAYLMSAVLYGWAGGRRAGVALGFLALAGWNIGTLVDFSPLPVVGNASAAAVLMGGVLAGTLLRTEPTVERRVGLLAGLAVLMTVVAAILQTRFPVSKIGSTPSWWLYSAAIVTGLLVVFHLAVDVRGHAAWVRPLLPAGTNALLFYLLPDFFYAVFGLRWLEPWLGHGALGLFRATVFAVAVMAVGTLLTRRGARLHA